MTEETNEQNFKACPRWNYCSINICPLDPDAGIRNRLPGENPCPFTIKKKSRGQKGIRTLAPASVLEVIPKSNLKMLNNRNQKRWHKING